MKLADPLRLVVCLMLAGAALPACDSSSPEAPAAPAAAPAAPRTPPSAAVGTTGADNRPPTIRRLRFEPEEPMAGQKLRVVAEASDPEGEPLWFHYEWKIDGEPAGNGEDSLVANRVRKGQSVEVHVVANDGTHDSAPAWAQVDISNSPPVIESLGIEPSQDVVSGTPIVVHPEGKDADDDALRYTFEWTLNDRPQRVEGPLFETGKLRRGDVVRVTVVAHDGSAHSPSAESPAIVVTNSPPEIVSRPPVKLDDGNFRYRVVAKDPDGDTLFDYRLEEAPEGMRIESQTGAISWTPATDQAGVHTVVVLCEDRHAGVGRHEFEVRVSASGGAPAAPAP